MSVVEGRSLLSKAYRALSVNFFHVTIVWLHVDTNKLPRTSLIGFLKGGPAFNSEKERKAEIKPAFQDIGTL
jgi:hypothetical protein